LGAQKVKIDDNNPFNSAYDATVQVGNEDLNNVQADIKGSGTSSNWKTSEIVFRYRPSSNLYVPVNGKLSMTADEEEGETGNVIFDGFDIEFKGLAVGTTETVKVEPYNSYSYKLTFYNRNGDKYSVPMWSAMSDSSPNVLLGEYDGSTFKRLRINETQGILDEEYFILSPSATQKTHIFQFKSVNANDATFKIKDLMEGGATIEANNATTFTVDGTGFMANYTGTGSSAVLYIDLNGDGSMDDTSVDTIYTRYSGSDGYIEVKENHTGQTANFTHLVTEKTENKPSNDYQEDINWTLTWDAANDKLKLTSPQSTFGSYAAMRKLEDKDIYEGWTYYGIFGSYDYTNPDQPSFEMVIPDEQAQALVYVTSGATTSTEASSGGTVTEVVQKIDVGAVKLASEVTTPSAHNLILVGGPCANSVARQVMGVSSANCAEGFTAGKAMIKLYEHAPGKVAMVVAGATAVDTRRASQVVANYKDYAANLKGEEVVVTTVTSTPTVAMPEPAAVEETA
jgi:hypothetical protein